MFGWELFAGALQDSFHVDFPHFLADFEVHQVTATAIEDGAEEGQMTGREASVSNDSTTRPDSIAEDMENSPEMVRVHLYTIADQPGQLQSW
jgi:hypothetical protein